MRPLELLCYGHRLRTNGGWNILRILYKKRLLFTRKEEALEMLQRKKPLDDVNGLRKETVTIHLLFHIQIEFKLY
jgi:hypothetical protein